MQFMNIFQKKIKTIMKMKLLRAYTALVSALMLFLTGFAGMDAYAAAVNEVRNGTVAVVLYLYDAAIYITDGVDIEIVENLGNTQYSSGSGFFVGNSGEDPQYIVTNCHVIDHISPTSV